MANGNIVIIRQSDFTIQIGFLWVDTANSSSVVKLNSFLSTRYIPSCAVCNIEISFWAKASWPSSNTPAVPTVISSISYHWLINNGNREGTLPQVTVWSHCYGPHFPDLSYWWFKVLSFIRHHFKWICYKRLPYKLHLLNKHTYSRAWHVTST